MKPYSLGQEIEATAQWLDQHSAPGAATVLRRVAAQRTHAREQLTAARARTHRYRQAWYSARRRARRHTTELELLTRQVNDQQAQLHAQRTAVAHPGTDLVRENAVLRVEIARCQALAERTGWMDGSTPRTLWRWRHGWWELAFRKRNAKDGYPDTGWYLWGPTAGEPDGEWAGRMKGEAKVGADRLITHYLTSQATR
ncbi:hypothetical protein [Streptomyces sp. NPDC014733]|uniref:hypothetical protein n=1 Tax=Streptomyces sp. NPDC014733 TaxID=3364885 RepID=UPI00370328E3